MIFTRLVVFSLSFLSQTIAVQRNANHHRRLPKFPFLSGILPKSLHGKTLIPTNHVSFMTNVSVEPVAVDLSPKHESFLKEQGIPTKNLKWIHNHTHVFNNPQYVFHSDILLYGIVANRIDLSFTSWNWEKQEAKFSADLYGLVFGYSQGGGTCWLNYDASWLADNNWGADAWSWGAGDAVGGMSVSFSGASQEAIGSCLYGIAGLEVSYSGRGWGNFHH